MEKQHRLSLVVSGRRYERSEAISGQLAKYLTHSQIYNVFNSLTR